MNKFFKKNHLLTYFLLGLLFRLSLLFYDFSWDLNNHIVWAKDLWQRGFAGFYEIQSSEVYATLYPNYPPLSLFLFYLFYPLHTLIEKIAWIINISIPLFPSKLIFFIQSRSFLAATLKLPAVFADLGIAWICYLFAKKTTGHRLTNKLITAFILFNPAFFFNSAMWGQIDAIPIFFVLVSIYLIMFSEKYLLSGVFFVLGILTKPTAFVFLPVYILFFIKKFRLINFIKAALLGFFIFYLSFIPFLNNFASPWLPFEIFSQKIMAAQSLPYVTNGAFNLWVLLHGFEGIKDTVPFLLSISYRYWGYFITGLFTVSILFRIFRRNASRYFFFASFLVAFASFLFLTKMHERYSILPLPFLLLASIKNKKLIKWFVALSSISLLNLYHSWPVPKLGIFTGLLYYPQVTFGISLFNVFLFFYLLLQ
ncbi:hypothetical protein A2774_01200 [Candidatus Roizmanbacteria bacterium RIFCSPHIGHO2_01_FULL_39_12c]|uniref:Glycosyltransferase RgtA/B/C/D-like domain-containing protein n=1 Tax=Candidatus Roizmanbacteria bacterium RIFCSPHIGHO2_01_FULL_39_12c TaxID=1802031 RepID=A0A1F7G7X1_9BACT|nr:MAG: hypothetical protein A2774_01200 [Candidatus Roizmanbacteria bacterium RIFCSPHIGHO2_01_FULL_39_12c]OGK46445.1 MAG: hypothetical protein A2963_01605 [Candidatus Roizmanbacteria bacterium RIFCSPLOWO2_01_FULL_40_13]